MRRSVRASDAYWFAVAIWCVSEGTIWCFIDRLGTPLTVVVRSRQLDDLAYVKPLGLEPAVWTENTRPLICVQLS